MYRALFGAQSITTVSIKCLLEQSTKTVHQGMYFQKFYSSVANSFRSTPDIFTLSFVNDYFEIFLLISLMVAMVTPTKMAMFIYLTSEHNLKLVPRYWNNSVVDECSQ